jgi:hypothetical protein
LQSRNADRRNPDSDKGIYNHALDDIKITISKLGITDRLLSY